MPDFNDIKSMDTDALLDFIEESVSNYVNAIIEITNRSEMKMTGEQIERLGNIILNQTSRAYDITGITKSQLEGGIKPLTTLIFNDDR